MKNWRPKEGWKNPYKRGRYIAVQHPDKHIGETFENEEKEFQIYEAGADAMLEALKAKGTLMTPEQMKLITPNREYPYGYLVFIPDDDTD